MTKTATYKGFRIWLQANSETKFLRTPRECVISAYMNFVHPGRVHFVTNGAVYEVVTSKCCGQSLLSLKPCHKLTSEQIQMHACLAPMLKKESYTGAEVIKAFEIVEAREIVRTLEE